MRCDLNTLSRSVIRQVRDGWLTIGAVPNWASCASRAGGCWQAELHHGSAIHGATVVLVVLAEKQASGSGKARAGTPVPGVHQGPVAGLLTRRERVGRALSACPAQRCRPDQPDLARSCPEAVQVLESPVRSADPGPGSLARGTHVRQLRLPPDKCDWGPWAAPSGDPGHLGRRGRLIP